MLRISRKTTTTLVFLAAVVGGFLIVRLNSSSGSSTLEFREARLQGAMISQDIVNLSNDLSDKLKEVNNLDKEYKLADALVLTTELLKKSNEVKSRAADLSAQLEKMISGLPAIESQEARQAALESISSRMAIISRLISYSDYIGQLLNALQSRFAGGQPNVQVKTLIDQINNEVTAINNFNREAGEAIDRFDRLSE